MYVWTVNTHTREEVDVRIWMEEASSPQNAAISEEDRKTEHADDYQRQD